LNTNKVIYLFVKIKVLFVPFVPLLPPFMSLYLQYAARRRLILVHPQNQLRHRSAGLIYRHIQLHAPKNAVIPVNSMSVPYCVS